MTFNGDGILSVAGTTIGLLACPENPPSNISFLYAGGSGGSYLTWTDVRDQIIGLVSDPFQVEAGLFSWWQSEYPEYQVAPL
jgi:hypothetical protein